MSEKLSEQFVKLLGEYSKRRQLGVDYGSAVIDIGCSAIHGADAILSALQPSALIDRRL